MYYQFKLRLRDPLAPDPLIVVVDSPSREDLDQDMEDIMGAVATDMVCFPEDITILEVGEAEPSAITALIQHPNGRMWM